MTTRWLKASSVRSKNEIVHHRNYQTRDEAQMEIFEYIELFYNRVYGGHKQ